MIFLLMLRGFYFEKKGIYFIMFTMLTDEEKS